ncbi:hypothetical protein MG293_004170 [Ovis ammon polii]|uniref:Lipocalin/cytosolic fatty-acid binding domain-containing protein n=1 Tax=Ovis ammon polii TaxID=230172 RepID=A0AAD4YE36_OVIAM|nr:hypothetical protein MG293_004170 [Ovis ammon polii]
MRALLLTLGLVASLQAQDALVLDSWTEDVSGKWYLKAVTTDQDVPGKNQESVTAMTFSVLEGGDLEAKVTLRVDGQCQETGLVLEQTNDPGRYTAYGGKSEVFILPLRAQDHFILYCEGELGGRQIRVARLLGEGPASQPRKAPPAPFPCAFCSGEAPEEAAGPTLQLGVRGGRCGRRMPAKKPGEQPRGLGGIHGVRKSQKVEPEDLQAPAERNLLSQRKLGTRGFCYDVDVVLEKTSRSGTYTACRNPDVNPEALEAFKKFAQRKGLSPEDIFTPQQTESCKPESD